MKRRRINTINRIEFSKEIKDISMIPLPFLLLVISEFLYSITRIESTPSGVDTGTIPFRFHDIGMNQCEHNVEMLANLTNPITEPWFVELSGVIEKEMLTITVVMNVRVMKNNSIINPIVVHS